MKVAIVGLGTAGIRSAMLLERAGVEVDLFEARDRLGGRLWTRALDAGPAYEAGGEWIDSDHRRVLSLLDELGIAKEEPLQWPGAVVFGEESSTEDHLWPDAAQAESELENWTSESLLSLGSAPVRERLDHTALSEMLDTFASTPRARWWLETRLRSDEGDDTNTLSALGWLLGQQAYQGREDAAMSAYRVKGGWSGVFNAMSSALRARPRFNHRLTSLERFSEGWRLRFDGVDVEAQKVVLTLPPPCLGEIEFEPTLCSKRADAIRGRSMGRAIKLAMRFRRRFWSESRLIANRRFQQLWDGSMGEDAILNAYVCGQGAIKLLEAPDPLGVAVTELAVIWPEAKESFVEGWVHDWISDPFSRGAFSRLDPGYLTAYGADAWSPHEGVHFAGEHTAQRWNGFIEGALESAERAVKEILNA